MKKIYFLGILSLIFSATAFSQSDNVQNPITDEERLLEATIVCLDALEAPTKYNEFAKPFISMPGLASTMSLPSRSSVCPVSLSLLPPSLMMT